VSEVRVAVVIPCWNDGATLEASIESARHQEPCEIVVIDDGSTDPATVELMEQLQGNGTTVIRQSNRGAAAARMAGVAVTSSPYVLPLDADDLLTPHALARLADALDEAPNAALVWGDQISFGDAEIYMRMAPVLDPWWITYENTLPMTSLVRRRHHRPAHPVRDAPLPPPRNTPVPRGPAEARRAPRAARATPRSALCRA
jgi:glycosyltransferase involved in cell wall biosynthesis